MQVPMSHCRKLFDELFLFLLQIWGDIFQIRTAFVLANQFNQLLPIRAELLQIEAHLIQIGTSNTNLRNYCK